MTAPVEIKGKIHYAGRRKRVGVQRRVRHHLHFRQAYFTMPAVGGYIQPVFVISSVIDKVKGYRSCVHPG